MLNHPAAVAVDEVLTLLGRLEEQTCDLRCIDVPTGGDDADVEWVVIQHWMAKPHEREIGRGSTIVKALRAAFDR